MFPGLSHAGLGSKILEDWASRMHFWDVHGPTRGRVFVKGGGGRHAPVRSTNATGNSLLLAWARVQ